MGHFKMSGDVSDAKNDLSDFFSDANDDLLKKGAPEGCGANILSWGINENKILIEISSDRYVRAHDAMLRIRKPLSGILGKKYRIGVRGIEIERFTISLESKEPLE